MYRVVPNQMQGLVSPNEVEETRYGQVTINISGKHYSKKC